MPPIIGKPVGKVAQEISRLESGQIFQSPVNKIWRSLILLNRVSSPMPKAETKVSGKLADAANKHIAVKGSISPAQAKNPWTVKKPIIQAQKALTDHSKAYDNFNLHQADRNSFSSANQLDPWAKFRILESWSNGLISAEEVKEAGAMDYTLMNQELMENIKNDIVIANLGISPAVSIVIQNRPNELRIDPTSTWAAVKSMGRNNPFYFYTGGEDTISFDISWYSVDSEHLDDVVNKCRLLESWTRANGYSSGPPVLRIQWGNSGLFEDDLFILTSAQYTLTHFQNSSRSGRYKHNEYGQRIVDGGIKVVDLKLLPNYAVQSLVFKRVSSSNRTWEDIIPSSKLQRTPGINYSSSDSNSLENISSE